MNRQAVEGRSTEPVIDDEFLPLDGAPAFRTMLTLLSANSEARESATLASGAAWATRRRNAPSEPGASPCIEVTHADGVHFVLSQQDGVWLLSLKDQHAMSAEQLERLVQDLRRHFAERGLGEIDVIA